MEECHPSVCMTRPTEGHRNIKYDGDIGYSLARITEPLNLRARISDMYTTFASAYAVASRAASL